ncbi:hypothetical protein BCR43DRAFT_481687 [Syncephalastrum racemosum]|uniref:Uncharacterized protein n=1 Tax=Syncephalastrum racemosum TaxID=13706 RepID=A0A1X2HSJ0_SYNRA|nr:hypothetical protein BCR43DRAFT_481687 [Syncephalastrum racemosum]
MTRVRLDKLALIPGEELEQGLRRCLAPYGQALQLALLEGPKLGWFSGRGYAVLTAMILITVSSSNTSDGSF